ncbi:Yellow-f4, partial [Operophtera brumata]
PPRVEELVSVYRPAVDRCHRLWVVDTGLLEVPGTMEGDKGPNTQSGSHAYHSGSRTIFFANVAQDAILCWNVDKPLTPQNVGMAAQDHKKLTK